MSGTTKPLLYISSRKQAELRAEFKAMTHRHIWLKPDTIKHFLTAAEEQAQLALQDNEVPIGAVIVHQEQIIARGYNHTRRDNNIMAHAEIVAISQPNNICRIIGLTNAIFI